MAATDQEHLDQFAQDVWANRNEPKAAHPMFAELADAYLRLRDQVRWRKWPDEKPEKTGCKYQYTAIVNHYPLQAIFISGRWFLDESRNDDDVTDKVTYWRLIGELPGKGGAA